MDPVSLALGIAPLCLGALKGAKHAKSKIRLLKHHSRELSRFRKRFKTQVSIFRDESQLLLQGAGVEPDLATEMLDDHSHGNWTDAGLDDQIRCFLGRKYAEVKDVSGQIHDQVTHLDVILGSLEDSDEDSGRGKVSTNTRTFRKPSLVFSADFGLQLAVNAHRARRAVGVASKKSSLDEGLESLTDSVHEFRRLRKAAKEFQKPRAACTKPEKAMPRTYGLVARHSASFLEALTKTWSCLNSNGVHSTHTAKLFLDTDAADDCVNFRMILEYEAVSGNLRQQ